MARQRMCEADRQQYGGPEWIDFLGALRWIDDLDYDTLEAVERQVRDVLAPEFPDTKVSLVWVIQQLLEKSAPAGLVVMMRTRLWLALIAEGVQIELASFRPKVYKADWEAPPPKKKAGDADPPAGSLESSPESTPDSTADTPASDASTSQSLPSSPARTASRRRRSGA